MFDHSRARDRRCSRRASNHPRGRAHRCSSRRDPPTPSVSWGIGRARRFGDLRGAPPHRPPLEPHSPRRSRSGCSRTPRPVRAKPDRSMLSCALSIHLIAVEAHVGTCAERVGAIGMVWSRPGGAATSAPARLAVNSVKDRHCCARGWRRCPYCAPVTRECVRRQHAGQMASCRKDAHDQFSRRHQIDTVAHFKATGHRHQAASRYRLTLRDVVAEGIAQRSVVR
jgi:hypothetical protein